MKKLTILIIIGLFSCSKPGKNVGVKGRIVNPITNEGMPNVEVILLTSESLSLPGGFKKIKSTTTDENGNFEIYALRVFKPVWVQAEILNEYGVGWFSDGSYISNGFRANVNKGKKMLADFHAVPYGQTILDIQNVNCSGPTDTMWFRHRSQFESEFPESWSTPRVGCYTYISPSPNPNLYMGTRYYQVRVKRNGQTTITEHEFFINQNGVTTIQLHY